MGFEITRVYPRSPAAKAGLRAGETLVRMNGVPLVDAVDYLYLSAEPQVRLRVRARDGAEREVAVRKRPEQDLGIEYAGDGFGKRRACSNNCKFCFVAQLPPGMRQTLYFKDDDWRMSFVMGNYVTLTNVSDREFARILARRVSPLYISVHAVDEVVRARLIGNARHPILPRLRALAEVGLTFHCQAVLVPGENDGVVLDETIRVLQELYPYAASLALVPVGLTQFRDNLPALKPFDAPAAQAVLALARDWQQRCLAVHGTRFVFAADEFYLRAGEQVPPAEHYEDFAQFEDGVGMLAKFSQEFNTALEECTERSRLSAVSIATGQAAAPFFEQFAAACSARLGVNISVYPIENHFFGPNITVAGLLTGRDLLEQLAGKPLGEKLLLSNTMLRDRENVFLDDVTIEQICVILNTEVRAVEPDGYDFMEALLGR